MFRANSFCESLKGSGPHITDIHAIDWCILFAIGGERKQLCQIPGPSSLGLYGFS